MQQATYRRRDEMHNVPITSAGVTLVRAVVKARRMLRRLPTRTVFSRATLVSLGL